MVFCVAECAVSGKPDPRKASAADSKSQSRTLNSVIYPSLSKLLKLHPEEDAVAAIAQLKLAFDQCEKAKPGITHALVVQLIDQLKGSVRLLACLCASLRVRCVVLTCACSTKK